MTQKTEEFISLKVLHMPSEYGSYVYCIEYTASIKDEGRLVPQVGLCNVEFDWLVRAVH